MLVSIKQSSYSHSNAQYLIHNIKLLLIQSLLKVWLTFDVLKSNLVLDNSHKYQVNNLADGHETLHTAEITYGGMIFIMCKQSPEKPGISFTFVSSPKSLKGTG